MSVVLRCPTCGTTQDHPGECDACSDDQVRYFCRNHEPALWLDRPVCGTCGARFGQAPEAPRPARPPRSSEVAPSPRRTRRSDRVSPSPSSDDDRPRTSPREPEIVPAAPSLTDLLARVLAARRRYRGGDRDGWERGWDSTPEFRLPTFPLAGCLVRLAWLGLLLFVLALTMGWLLLGGLAQMLNGTVYVY